MLCPTLTNPVRTRASLLRSRVHAIVRAVIWAAALALPLHATGCDSGVSVWPSTTGSGPRAGDQPGAPGGGGGGGGGSSVAMPADGSAPLLLMASTLDSEVNARAAELNSIRAYLIYQNSGEVDGRYDEAKFRREVERIVPAAWGGPVSLDFEGRWLAWLSEDPSSVEFQRGEAAMLELIRVAREVRPNAKWSVYGVPTLRAFVASPTGSTVGWHLGSEESKARALERGRAARRVVQACDWVAPTIYDLHDTERLPRHAPAQVARVEALVGLAVELAEGRPVYPFVWHRVHPSSREDGLKLMSNAQFINGQVRPSLEAGASGVIWWGADRLHIRRGTIGGRQPQEVAGLDIEDLDAVDAMVRRIHLEKIEALAPLFPRVQ